MLNIDTVWVAVQWNYWFQPLITQVGFKYSQNNIMWYPSGKQHIIGPQQLPTCTCTCSYIVSIGPQITRFYQWESRLFVYMYL